jgi:hypothetical protein
MEILLLPNWLLARLALTPAQRIHLNAFASILVAAAATPLAVKLPHICLFQYFLHIPCPGCGITHALFALARLDVSTAWHANPAGIILAAFLVSQLIARPVALFAARTEQTVARLSRHGSIITILCLVAVWLSRWIAK